MTVGCSMQRKEWMPPNMNAGPLHPGAPCTLSPPIPCPSTLLPSPLLPPFAGMASLKLKPAAVPAPEPEWAAGLEAGSAQLAAWLATKIKSIPGLRLHQ